MEKKEIKKGGGGGRKEERKIRQKLATFCGCYDCLSCFRIILIFGEVLHRWLRFLDEFVCQKKKDKKKRKKKNEN
jgi:hypothetical protein